MKDSYAVGRGSGFDNERRPLVRLMARCYSEETHSIFYDLAAEAFPARIVAQQPDELRRLAAENRELTADRTSAELLERAAREGCWIVMTGVHGMPDGKDDMIVHAEKAFIPPTSFDPLAARDPVGVCADAVALEFHNPRVSGTLTMRPLSDDDLLQEAGAEHAKSEPDEAIIWVRADGLTVCVAHTGAYLYWAAPEHGPQCRDIGFSEPPDEPGFYFFSGKSWSDCSGPDYEFDAGIDGDYEPLRDEHLARFSITMDGLKEEVREYEEEIAPAV